jgi:E3 ubiquitin-protein ligase RBX1
MADVDMKDAPAPKAKVAKAGAADAGDKKRFEVKKVSVHSKPCPSLLG